MLKPRLAVADTNRLATASTSWDGAATSTRLYDRHWRRAREQYLLRNPLCVECLEEHKTVAANEVDHVIPHKGDMVLFWDEKNWQSLCKPHHSRKTHRENNL